MRAALTHYKSSNEATYNALLCIIGGLLWALLAVSLLSDGSAGIFIIAIYAIPVVIVLTISALLFRATAMGNMVLVNEQQFPHIHQMVVEGSERLGMTPPETFIYNANGVFNAFARQVFGRKYLLLTSSIVEVTTDEQIRFIVGHELGHHAAGHLNFWLFMLRLPARLVPFLHKAYSRQCEYTSDKLGLYVTRNVHDSCTALSMLACGCQKLNPKLNLTAFEKQETLVPETSGYFAEILRTHPRLTRRVLALKATQIQD